MKHISGILGFHPHDGSMVLLYMVCHGSHQCNPFMLAYIRVNYNISLTSIKAIWGWFPLLTMIPVRSQWGRYNLPRYIYIYTSTMDPLVIVGQRNPFLETKNVPGKKTASPTLKEHIQTIRHTYHQRMNEMKTLAIRSDLDFKFSGFRVLI